MLIATELRTPRYAMLALRDVAMLTCCANRLVSLASDDGSPWRAMRSATTRLRSAGSGKRVVNAASSSAATLLVGGRVRNACGKVATSRDKETSQARRGIL